MPLVADNKLISNVVQVIADDLWLRTNSQNIVANTSDQCHLPARRDGAEGVPRVAGDKAELGGGNSKLILDICVSLGRRFMVFRAVRAESSFKQIEDAPMLKLARLHFKQIVREGEEPKTRITQLA
jgi:hypothetical protein